MRSRAGRAHRKFELASPDVALRAGDLGYPGRASNPHERELWIEERRRVVVLLAAPLRLDDGLRGPFDERVPGLAAFRVWRLRSYRSARGSFVGEA
jgi:hypothetical protein